MYSSTDLLNWTPLGAQNDLQYLWRPKIAKPNGSYWVSRLFSILYELGTMMAYALVHQIL
jgi:hypothetical protein